MVVVLCDEVRPVDKPEMLSEPGVLAAATCVPGIQRADARYFSGSASKASAQAELQK
jgi:hypothetical protein